MGGEQTRKGKHVYLFLAGLIFLSSGCAVLNERKTRVEVQDTLARSRTLLAYGDYDGALQETQDVLARAGNRPPSDEALFYQGLIYSQGDNPNRDDRKAVGIFQQLAQAYPQSPWTEASKRWIKMMQSNKELTEANETLTHANEKLTQANEKLNLTNEKLNQANEKLSQSNEKLNELIEKSKRVDIEIERKRRKK